MPIIPEGFMRLDFSASMRYHILTAFLAMTLLFSGGLSALAGFYPARLAAKTNKCLLRTKP